VLDFLTHLDRYLAEWAGSLGGWFYVLLFLVIFAETGLVVVPFLPGDSLLLTVGALANPVNANHEPFSVSLAAAVMCAGAIVGDSTNYWIGRHVGPRVFTSETSRLLNRKHLFKAKSFYERHGGKTVILCRFIAVIRTFAPFVAGVGAMRYPRFLAFSVLGTLLWVPTFVVLGYQLAGVAEDAVRWVVLGIILFAFVPPIVSYVRDRRAARRGGEPDDSASR
jgi:membrane-associated protein